MGLFQQVFEQVSERIRRKHHATLAIPQQWQAVNRQFQAIWIADGSTLEELRKKLKAIQGTGTVLGGWHHVSSGSIHSDEGN